MPSVIIVGASRGIGREFARAYAADGWEVIATVRDGGEPLDGVMLATADITDEASLAALPDGAVDLIVVNAGVGSHDGLARIDVANWTRVLTVNALGPMLAARALGDRLRDGGTFVALSSAMGSIAANSGGGAYSYRMSKAALNMGLANLNQEWRARRIAVAALHPGWVKTALGGDGAPVEIADSVAGMRRVIAGLSAGKTPRFIDYRGNALAW